MSGGLHQSDRARRACRLPEIGRYGGWSRWRNRAQLPGDCQISADDELRAGRWWLGGRNKGEFRGSRVRCGRNDRRCDRRIPDRGQQCAQRGRFERCPKLLVKFLLWKRGGERDCHPRCHREVQPAVRHGCIDYLYGRELSRAGSGPGRAERKRNGFDDGLQMADATAKRPMDCFVRKIVRVVGWGFFCRKRNRPSSRRKGRSDIRKCRNQDGRPAPEPARPGGEVAWQGNAQAGNLAVGRNGGSRRGDGFHPDGKDAPGCGKLGLKLVFAIPEENDSGRNSRMGNDFEIQPRDRGWGVGEERPDQGHTGPGGASGGASILAG